MRWIFSEASRLMFQTRSSSMTRSASRVTTSNTNAETDCPRMADASFNLFAVASGKRGFTRTTFLPGDLELVFGDAVFMKPTCREDPDASMQKWHHFGTTHLRAPAILVAGTFLAAAISTMRR